MIRSIVRQGERRDVRIVRRAARNLYSPWGRVIDALVIPRSYQETLEEEFGSVEAALNGVDQLWHQRDLVIFPSHLVPADCKVLLDLANGAGFDTVAVPIFLQPSELKKSAACLALSWNERWTLSNDTTEKPNSQIEALGHDLWAWIAAGLERR